MAGTSDWLLFAGIGVGAYYLLTRGAGPSDASTGNLPGTPEHLPGNPAGLPAGPDTTPGGAGNPATLPPLPVITGPVVNPGNRVNIGAPLGGRTGGAPLGGRTGGNPSPTPKTGQTPPTIDPRLTPPVFSKDVLNGPGSPNPGGSPNPTGAPIIVTPSTRVIVGAPLGHSATAPAPPAVPIIVTARYVTGKTVGGLRGR